MQIKNLKTFKIGLRKKYRGIRERMPERVQSTMDNNITERLMKLSSYNKSNYIFTYVSKSIEVDTYKIIEESLKRGKRVAVPKCNPEQRSMEFYFITSFDDLEKGLFGVYEPIADECTLVTNFDYGLCIVPGFCFDSYGYRLGYGHGYYDRFLPKFKGTTVGLCYSNCINFRLPHGRFDRSVNILVTDRYIRKIYKMKSSSKSRGFSR